MLNVCLDTSVIAIPNFAEDADFADEIISRAFEYSSAISNKLNLRVLISSTAEAVLWENGCGPDEDTITAFLQMVGLHEFYSSKDVLLAYQVLLDRSQRYPDVMWDEASDFREVESEPGIPSGIGPTALVNEAQRTMLTGVLAANRQLGVALSLGFPGTTDVEEVVISGIVDNTCHPSQPGLTLPAAVTGTIPLLASPSLLVSEGWSKYLWNKAQAEEDFHLAIATRALSLLREAGAKPTYKDVAHFTIGPDFIGSLQDHQAVANGRHANLVLEVCAQLAANCCNRFQRHMGAAEKIYRGRDNAKAMRVHLTDSHEALRLMYWKTDKALEFANVGGKFELWISEGRAAAERASRLEGLGI